MGAPPGVTVTPAGHALTVLIRWIDLRYWWKWHTVPVLLAIDVAIVLSVRYSLVVAQSWGLLIPIGMFLLLPAVALHQHSLRDLLNTTTFTAEADVLTARTGPMDALEVTLDPTTLTGFSIDTEHWRSQITAHGKDGEGTVLARQLVPESAAAAVETLEQHYGLPHTLLAPVEPRPRIRLVVVTLISLAVVGYGTTSLRGPAIRDLVARAEVADGPATAAFELDGPTTAQVWVRASLSIDEAWNTDNFVLSRLPQAFQLQLDLQSGSQAWTVHCNPLDVGFVVDQTVSSGLRRTSTSYYGQLSGCAVALSDGPGQLTATLISGDGADRYVIDQMDVQLRR